MNISEEIVCGTVGIELITGELWDLTERGKWKVKVKSLSRVRLFATPWTVAHQAPLSMGFSRQEYWSGLPFPSPEDRYSRPRDWTQVSHIAGRRFNLWATREAWINEKGPNFYNFLFPHLHCCRGHWHSSLSRKPECLACFPLDLGYGRNQAKPIFFFFFFWYILILWLQHIVCGILVPQPGIEPMPPALAAPSVNHWTTREVPQANLVKKIISY